jgi:hypothetical protein
MFDSGGSEHSTGDEEPAGSATESSTDKEDSSAQSRRRVCRSGGHASGFQLLGLLLTIAALSTSTFVVLAVQPAVPLSGTSFTVSGEPQICEHCPNGESGCIPHCVSCPTPITIDFTNVVATPEATNVSLSWDESPSYSNATTTFSWGNLTGGPTYNVNWTGGSRFSTFADFLNSSTRYSFTLTANTPDRPCGRQYASGAYSGSWTTLSEQTYYNLTDSWEISGTVEDVSNNTPSVNTIVVAHCSQFLPNQATLGNPEDPLTWWDFSEAIGTHPYKLDVSDEPYSSQNVCGSDGLTYVVSVENGPFCFNQVCAGNTWEGQWNETITTWVPQTVNFHLPTVFYSPTIVNYALFTSSSLVNLEFCKYSSSSWSYSAGSTSSYGFDGVSGSYTSSVSVSGGFGSGFCAETYGEPSNEDWGTYLTTGGILVNNVDNRVVSDQWMQYYGGEVGGGIGSGGPINNPVSEPTGISSACYTQGVHWYQRYIGPNTQLQVQLGASGTISQLGSDSLSFNLAQSLASLVYIPGIGEAAGYVASSLSATSSWQYSWSTSLTDQFNVTADIVTGSTGHEFTLACQGSSTQGQGLAIEVWQDT